MNHQEQTKKAYIDVCTTAAAAWKILSDYASVEPWAPCIRSCTLVGDQERGVGARRKLRHYLGFRIEEVVTEWDEGSGLSFALVRAPFLMKNARENMHIEQRGSMVRIHSKVTYGMQLGLLGAWLDRLLVSRLVSRDMRNSLAGLKELLEGVPIPDGNTKPAIESSFR